ncbi:MAG: pectin acetylesterase-family hydrolase [Anaerolineae bacterium]
MMRRRLRIFFSVLAIIVVVLGVLLFLAYKLFVHTPSITEYASFSDVPLYTWTHVNLSDETMCSEGSAYRFYVRRGESPNLIIHFAGGGACWDAATCSQPITLTHFSGFYFPTSWEIFPNVLNGILNNQNSANPFHDWNAVYIPYCTADFHIGSADPTYTSADNQALTVHHRGRQNVTEALSWVLDTFPQPPTLLISGESAGGFGSIFWTPTIAAQYPASDIYQLADGVYLETPLWDEIVHEAWQSDMLSVVGADLAGDAYRSYVAASTPNITYLHINTLFDGTLLYFNSYLNGVSGDAAYVESWSQHMRASMQQTAASGLNYYFYLTDYGLDPQTQLTPHTSISGPLFFDVTEDEVPLSQWLRRIVIDGERFSVGESFLP